MMMFIMMMMMKNSLNGQDSRHKLCNHSKNSWKLVWYFPAHEKMVVKNGVRCGGTRWKTNILGCDNKMAFMDRSIGDYFSNFVLVFQFLLRKTSISWCIRVLKIGKNKKNLWNWLFFLCIISHCQCQSLERKICRCKKITHILGMP